MLRFPPSALYAWGMSHAYDSPADKAKGQSDSPGALSWESPIFDTAVVYGPFDNEELVDEALKDVLQDQDWVCRFFPFIYQVVLNGCVSIFGIVAPELKGVLSVVFLWGLVVP